MPRRPFGGALPLATESPVPASLLRRAPAVMSPNMFDMGLDNIDLWRSEEMQLVQVRERARERGRHNTEPMLLPSPTWFVDRPRAAQRGR